MFDCLGAGCHDCCVDTRMPLCLADIRRLRRLGYRMDDFLVLVHGERRLRNVDGRCFFLGDSGCSVYEIRPAGCRFYPLVIDTGGWARIDQSCRFRDRFTVDAMDVDRLWRFVKLLRRERRRELS